MKKLLVLIKGDIKNISRDYLFLMSFLAPLLIMAFTRFCLPQIAIYLDQYLSFDIREHYILIAGFFLILIPFLTGTLGGFMFLDERDDNILNYVAITPFTKTRYLCYRLAVPLAISIIFSLLFLKLSGIGGIPFFKGSLVVLIASIEAPLMALFLASFAKNKVEGLALSKLMGLILFPPLFGYVAQTDWQYLCGIFPPFWITEAIISIGAGKLFWYNIFSGLMIHLIFLYFLYRKFESE